MYQGGNSSWTDTTSKLQVSKIILNSNQNLNAIKNNLTNALSNTINLVSDYSGSLIDKRNIIDPTGKGNDETTLLNSAISKVLSNEYNDWKQYIQPFSFSDDTRKATTTIKFNDTVTSQQQVWTFNTPINITLSQNYWGKSLNERMHLLPGQIVNPDDSTKGMIIDTPDILDRPDPSKNYGGTLRYHTTASIEFDSLLNNTEWLEINGTKIDVLYNKFSATLLDNRVSGEKNNTYDIIAYHKDDKYKAQYEIKVVIETLVPDLKLKWYAWDPDKNPEQNILITPNLPDGKPNPKYDKEINADTGTKTQIIWVKNKSLVPFALDPLDKNGNVIDPNKNPEEYDLGFIAEGAFAGKGVNQTFNDSNILSVYRQGVQNTLEPFNNPNDRQKKTQITSDSDTQYWSDSGIWHYIENLSDKSSAQKFMIIGADYSNQYPRFLDILNNSNIAVDFWTTIHGVHLKNYLATYKGFDSAKIGDLSYEQVAAYWKEYTSDVISQRIPPDPTPANYTDITGNIPIIKMNETDLDAIVSNILVDVDKYITSKSPNAKIKSDYNIYSPDGKDITIDNSGLSSLLQDQINPQYLGLIVKSSSTSTLLIGTARVQVRNSSTYDPTNVRDLSKIKFENYKYNFADFTPEQLRTWIYKDVDNYMNTYGYNDMTLNEDYGISGNRIPDEDPITHHNTPGDLNDLLLKDFLDNSTGVKTLTIIVFMVMMLVIKQRVIHIKL
ncbi:MAG: hypothetical protein OHM56_03125 [Spiroplasma phoeniceum]|nr:MAG: hypothetical protein OHM57_02575 [Spiroplasma phoeniceum]UZQ32958.1 MAG: hypothetical protein OHM56_03125 [Spiroplasma phoeniceum]